MALAFVRFTGGSWVPAMWTKHVYHLTDDLKTKTETRALCGEANIRQGHAGVDLEAVHWVLVHGQICSTCLWVLVGRRA